MSLASDSASRDDREQPEDKGLLHKLNDQVQEKSMQLAALQQSYEHQLKSAQETIDRQNCELQSVRKMSIRSHETISFVSLLPSHSSRWEAL